jgi:hypothetical protein
MSDHQECHDGDETGCINPTLHGRSPRVGLCFEINSAVWSSSLSLRGRLWISNFAEIKHSFFEAPLSQRSAESDMVRGIIG